MLSDREFVIQNSYARTHVRRALLSVTTGHARAVRVALEVARLYLASMRHAAGMLACLHTATEHVLTFGGEPHAFAAPMTLISHEVDAVTDIIAALEHGDIDPIMRGPAGFNDASDDATPSDEGGDDGAA